MKMQRKDLVIDYMPSKNRLAKPKKQITLKQVLITLIIVNIVCLVCVLTALFLTIK